MQEQPHLRGVEQQKGACEAPVATAAAAKVLRFECAMAAAAAEKGQAAAGWDTDAHVDLYATVSVEFADMPPGLDTGRRASQAEQPGVEVVKVRTGTEVAEHNLSTADQGVNRQALPEEPDLLQEPVALLQSVVAAQEALEEEGERPLRVGAVLHLTAKEGHLRPLMPH